MHALLRHRLFVRYIAGEAVSMTGTWMQAMAQGWLMATLTDRALMLGMVNFAAGLPTIALMLLGGVVADRFSKRDVLLLTQIAQIACAATLGWLVGHGAIHVGHFIAVAGVLGVVLAFEMPAVQALVPELAGQEHMQQAIGVDRAVFHGTRLVGPATSSAASAPIGGRRPSRTSPPAASR